MRWQSSNVPSIGQRMDVGLADRRHLSALDIRHASVRVEDIDVGPGQSAESLDRRRSGVAGGCAENGRALAAVVEDAVHGAAEPLHGEVLERQRRSMEEFEREQVGLDLDERRGRRVAEAGVGAGGHRLEIGRTEIAADEFGHHAYGGVGVAQPAQAPGSSSGRHSGRASGA